MLNRISPRRKGASTLEYVTLLVVLMAAFFFTQKYIVRALAGRWKAVTDTFGGGRQYDPKVTRECVWSGEPQNKWYDPQCFEQKWNSDYSGYFNGCLNDCTGGNGDDWGACDSAGSSTCCRLVVFQVICRSDCCYSECTRRCTGTVTNSSIDACLSSGGIPCN